MVRGAIAHISPSEVKWIVGKCSSFNALVSCDSPDFEYNGRNWCLQWFVQKNESGVLRSLRLICKRSDADSGCFTQAYSLGTSDCHDFSHWNSPVLTDEFGPDSYGTSQDIPFSATDRPWNVTYKVFGIIERSFYLTFHAPKERQPGADVSLKEAKQRSRTATDAGTQTCSDGTVQLSQNFKDLLLKGHKTDVTLKVEGTEFEAHKVILSARSPVFEKMFDHDMVEETSGSVTITDCEAEVFHTFLLYLYTGKVEKPTVKSSVELYCLADKYNVEGLVPYCVQFLLSNLSVESYCAIVALGLIHCDREMLTPAKAFFARNLKQIIETEEWKCFITEKPAEANEILIQGLSEVNLVPKWVQEIRLKNEANLKIIK